MYKKAWCTCKVVVLLIKPIVFLTFSLQSASDLKVPNYCPRLDGHLSVLQYTAFSLTWPASRQIYWRPFHCFGTPTWPP